MRLSRKERAAKKGVNIDELGSGSDDKEDAAEDEDMDVDQANVRRFILSYHCI